MIAEAALKELYSNFFQSCSEHKTSIIKNNLNQYDANDTLLKFRLVNSVLNFSSAWGWSHGICFLPHGTSTIKATLVPYALLPSLIPRKCFIEAVELSPIFSRLIANITVSTKWLTSSLKAVGLRDPDFTQKLLNVAARCYGEAAHQRNIINDIKLILIRSDYMIHKNNTESILRQVEVNTISLSFSSFAESLQHLHQQVLRMLTNSYLNEKSIPNNQCNQEICKALRQTHAVYKRRHPSIVSPDILGTCILFIVNSSEKNEMDQRVLEISLNKMFPNEEFIPIARTTFNELYEMFSSESASNRHRSIPRLHRRTIQTDTDNDYPILIKSNAPSKGRLFIEAENGKGFWEISIIYYRTGYDPKDYEPNKSQSWLMREVLEMSESVKCPNIYTHLAGVKKIQSLWCDENELSIVLPHPEDRQKISATFVTQVETSDTTNPNVLSIIQEAIEKPDNFVLKPQREGGLNNIYGEDLSLLLKKSLHTTLEDSSFISSHNTDQTVINCRGVSYILMQKIKPESSMNATIQMSSHSEVSTEHIYANCMSCVSELGTFGIYLADGTDELLCCHAGHLLRTKDAKNLEGGVATGSAFLDSPCLVD